MKKKMVIFVILLVCISLAVYTSQSKKNIAIEEINRNCNAPFALTQPESTLQNINEYTKNQGFGGYSLENDDISFAIGGYPDCIDKYHIIGYQIKSSQYTLMGLQVGCTLETADKVMKQHGYSVLAEDNRLTRYTKDNVRIGISLSDNVVNIFHVSVEVTNKKNISF